MSCDSRVSHRPAFCKSGKEQDLPPLIFKSQLAQRYTF